MIEILHIIIQLFIFTFLFSLNYRTVNSNLLNKYNFNLFENFSLSIVLQLNIILFLSFLNITLDRIINIYLIINLFVLILNLYYLKLSFLKSRAISFEIFFLFFVSLIIFLDISHNLTLSWDAEKFWFEKTLNFYNGNTVESFVNVYRSHYPFFGDLIWAFFWKFSLISNEYAGRLFYAFLYVVAISVLVQNLKLPSLYKFTFIFLIILSTYDYRILFGGNKEVIIFSLFCLMMNCLYQLSTQNLKNENYYIFTFIMTSNLLIWTKQEGFIYLLSILITFIIFFKIKINKKLVVIFSCIFFIF